MNIREATGDDRERLRDLYTEFVSEIPPPAGLPLDLEHELGELDEYLSDHLALVAENGGEVVGFALAKLDDHPGVGELSDIYVAPGARRQGAARELIREVAERLGDQGAEAITLGVQVENADARAAYERLGFEAEAIRMFARTDRLLERTSQRPRGESFGSVHVQTDDEGAVALAVQKYVPRFGRSGGSVVAGPRNGWVTVYDELSDREPGTLWRLGSELSSATGAVVITLGVEEGAVVRYVVFERGSVVDEYQSVPEYYGPIPPGDIVALSANATVVARLTGADAARVRAVARTASSPDELPPAPELLQELAELMGLAG